jgi:glycosyltransferase involved in cell wall biosynthesis
MAQPRIVHIVENLHRGAVENWLVRMLRHARHRGLDVDWTFYCALGQTGAMEAEAKDLGAVVIHSPVRIGQKGEFVRALRRTLRAGRYDVLHCHHDLVSAVYLAAAAGLPIRSRIVHTHNADEDVLTPSPLKQWLFRGPMRRTCLALADKIVGNSDMSLDTLLAGRRRRAGRDLVHYYGIDPTAFREAKGDRKAFHRALGLSDDAKILLFAGRMVPEKNPLFAVDVLAEMRKRDARVVGVFAGSGSMDAPVARRASELGLGESFRALGWRNDISDIMCCCDWFILPHPEHPAEGFGIAVVEAQLAGLRLLLSKGITDAPLLPTAQYRRLALNDGPTAWADAALALLREPCPAREDAMAAFTRSPMDMDRALEDLLELHA